MDRQQNKGFFARGGELTQFIINSVRSGELTEIYRNDSLTSKLSKDDFMDRLVFQEGVEVEAWEAGYDYYEGDIVKYNGKVYTAIFDT